MDRIDAISDHLVTTILLVEDDPAHADLIESNLRRGGLDNPIVKLGDGQDALDFLYGKGAFEGHPRPKSLLMLLDLNMPNVDGSQVLSAVKADQALRKLPIIILTSTDDPREIEAAYDLGCNAYVNKPISYDKFVQTIQGLGMFVTLITLPSQYG